MRQLTLLLLVGAATAAADPYTVAPRPHGAVRFKVEGPLDDVVGETRMIAGNFEIDAKNVGMAKGVVAVDLSTLRTGIDERDRDMRVEFLQTQRFPFALMSIDKIERPSAAALAPGNGAEGEAVGTFEVHGVRRQLRVNVKLKMDEQQRIWVSGAFEVAFADYNITRPQRLFLKLGEVADVSFEVLLAPKPAAEPAPATADANAPKPPEAPTVANVQAAAVKAKPRPVKKPKPVIATPFLFSGDDLKAKGERLFHAPEVGGAGNKMSCAMCHAKADERNGLKQADGYARVGRSMYNAAQRPKLWNGFASNLGKASSICQKMFMRGGGLDDDQQKALTAFVEAISPDPVAELDYKLLWRTYESAIRDPTGGDFVRGKALGDVYCMVCHLDGRAAPPWAAGLYEPDWLVRRVRHLEGHADRYMPAFTIDRLPDTDLRDIVTYLTSPKSAPPIFNRKGTAAGGKASSP